jgi:hypothetical protein
MSKERPKEVVAFTDALRNLEGGIGFNFDSLNP